MNTKFILSIAGSDPGAGAGIQSDLKTFKNHGVYGLTVITAITSQNSFGVQKSFPLKPEIVSSQMKSVFASFDIKVVKIGMLGNEKIVKTVSSFLDSRKNIKVVLDPVIKSKNGFSLLNAKGIDSLKRDLLKLAYLVTPNFFEARILSGIKITNTDTLERAMKKLHSFGCKNVLVKGGHFDSKLGIDAGTDVLFDGTKFTLFKVPFINNRNTHGIGCTFSSAIASNFAKGVGLTKSISEAKIYIVKKLQKRHNFVKGIGPVEI